MVWKAVLVGVCCVAVGRVDADRPRGTRWLQAEGAPAITRVWGRGPVFYGVGAAGSFRSVDSGATWTVADGAVPANGVWGNGLDEVWIVRGRSLHHTSDGRQWHVRPLPGLSFGAAMEGMWGVEGERYLYGVDRSDGEPTGTILRSRDRGASWQRETLPVRIARIAGMWGRSPDDVYAVGAGGVVLHSTGEQWRVVRPASTGSLEAVWGTGKSVYAVGAGGTIVVSLDRGKTWVARQSGVKYTLTSITGAAGEILVGSHEGAPLRSTDGVTWRPLTAMVSRGNVWANDRDHVVVASSSGVQFLGEGPPLPDLPLPMVAVGGRLPDTVATARSQLARFRAQPFATLLLELAVHHLEQQSSPPRVIDPGQLPIRIGAVTNCSPAFDRPRVSSLGGEAVLNLKCLTPCGTSPQVDVSGDLPDGGIVRIDFPADPTWCTAPEPQVAAIVVDEVQRVHQRRSEDRLASARDRASDDALVDAYARYVLEGGTRSEHFFELARALRRSVHWRGFFWTRWESTTNHVCQRDMTRLEQDGDRRAISGDDQGAWTSYERVAHCDPRLTIKAVQLACRNQMTARAHQLIDHVPGTMRAKLVDSCRKSGVEISAAPR
jgi:hypothetical protein